MTQPVPAHPLNSLHVAAHRLVCGLICTGILSVVRPKHWKVWLGGLLPGLLMTGALAQSPKAPMPAPVEPTVTTASTKNPSATTLTETALEPEKPSFLPNQTLTLKALGAQYPLNLRGVDASNTLPFSIRADEVVRAARLNLGYAYSPSLLPDLSHINILLNDEVAATIPVPTNTAGQPLQRTIPLPPHLITAINQLRLQLIGHYTLECEDPLHSSLWVNVSNNSTLELALDPLPLPNDLSLLPLPFFDPRDITPLILPFVFSGVADPQVLEGAGALSSWFGTLAGQRRARFPVQRDLASSTGNAVVFVNGAAQASHFFKAPLTGPTLAVINNPQDPSSKFLLVMGRDGNEVKQAAIALAAGNQTLTGDSAQITEFADLKPRVPYDAPKWLRTDRPVAFGELIEKSRLNVSGYSPDLIRLDIRVPPDLFGWRENKVPIRLNYRYTPQPTSVNSSLLFSVDDLFMKSMPLFALDDLYDEQVAGSVAIPDQDIPSSALLEVPLEILTPRAQLQFRYMYDYVKQGACRDIIIDNVRGYIDPESTIDLTRYPHFKAMPDLSAFSNSGWPFTRLADLSETAVILPRQPAVEEIGLYLDLMGLMGESTGYPAVAVTVNDIGQIDAVSGKDLLVIASSAGKPALDYWNNVLSGSYTSADGKRLGTSDLLYKALTWSTPDPRDNKVPQRSLIAYDSNSVSAIVAGFESPATPGRSVVLVASNVPQGLEKAAGALLRNESFDGTVGGSLSIVRNGKIDQLIAEQTYYTGKLDWFKEFQWRYSTYLALLPRLTWEVLVGASVIALLIMALIWRLLKRFFRQRPPFGNGG